MDGTADKRCSHCGKTASLKCGHCKASWYCDVSCQKAHWSEHKPACKEADLDRTIHRAGQLLQDVFFLFREQLFDESIESIEDTGDTLFLRDRPRKPGTLIPFPHHLVRDEKEKKMVLSTLVCHEPIGYFHDLFIQMLKGEWTLCLKDASGIVILSSPRHSHSYRGSYREGQEASQEDARYSGSRRASG